MRVPTRSEGTRSGVNWTRANDPPRTPAVVLIVRVFASPGTPSIRRCPWARRHTRTRSSMSSWPAITRRISKSACSSRSLASAGEGTGKSVRWSVTSSPSFGYPESYTRAGELKFLLRADGASIDKRGMDRIPFAHDQVSNPAQIPRRRGRDGRGRAEVEKDRDRQLSGDHMAAQPCGRRQRRHCEDLL